MSNLQVRPATAGDVAGIANLVADRIGEEDVAEAVLVLEDPDYDEKRWSVVADGDRIVSTMATFPMDVRLGSTELPGAMIEFVATDREYEGRGLVRKQFDYHHHDLADRDEVFAVIVGITYFYRRLGYEYALPVAPWRQAPAGAVPSRPEGWTVRNATESDLANIIRLQRDAQAAADLSAGLSAELWRFVLRSPVYETLLAFRNGRAEGCCRLYDDEGKPYLMDTAVGSRAGMDALLSAVIQRYPDQDFSLLERHGISRHLEGVGTVGDSSGAYYARIADPVRWLNQMRPELSRRLRKSALGGAAGEGLISLYVSSIRFTYRDGEVGEFVAGPQEQAPISKGGSGVAPDLITSLLVGPLGFSGLADRHPDVIGGTQEELMDILFPPLRTDVQSWVVP